MFHTDTSTVQSAEDGLSPQEIDEVMSLLQVAERRSMLHALVEYGELPLTDLADEVVRRMQDGRSTESAEQEGQLHTALVHNHLPRVVDAGIVRVDQRRQTVALVEAGAKRNLIDQLCSVIGDVSI